MDFGTRAKQILVAEKLMERTIQGYKANFAEDFKLVKSNLVFSFSFMENYSNWELRPLRDSQIDFSAAELYALIVTVNHVSPIEQ